MRYSEVIIGGFGLGMILSNVADPTQMNGSHNCNILVEGLSISLSSVLAFYICERYRNKSKDNLVENLSLPVEIQDNLESYVEDKIKNSYNYRGLESKAG